MDESAITLLQSLPDTHLAGFATRWHDWLIADLNQNRQPVPEFTESRAKALLRAANVIDDPTLHAFARMGEMATAVRLALYDLLQDTGLAGVAETQSVVAATLPASIPTPPPVIPWLALAIAAHAWKSEYPLHQFDPTTPPGEYSPAGQVLKRAAYFLRQQVQRTATDRDKLGRKLAYAPPAAATVAATMPEPGPIPPLPPHFRPPIPVRYPEYARETLQVAPETPPPPSPERSEAITMTPDEVPGGGRSVQRMPEIRITNEQITPERPSSPPRSTVVTPRPTTAPASASSFTDNVRQFFGRGPEPMKTTRLRIVVAEYPDGPGIYGLQIKVSCKGVKSSVAGTTNREGKFLCELPVRLQAGLTYDVDVSWPRDLGGDTERKSITLHADRTEFTLPFHRRLHK